MTSHGFRYTVGSEEQPLRLPREGRPEEHDHRVERQGRSKGRNERVPDSLWTSRSASAACSCASAARTDQGSLAIDSTPL